MHQTTDFAEGRSQLIRKLVRTSMDAAHGIRQLSEQETNEMLSSLVKTKLLSADESYQLRDYLFDKTTLDKVIDRRIERVLRQQETPAAATSH